MIPVVVVVVVAAAAAFVAVGSTSFSVKTCLSMTVTRPPLSLLSMPALPLGPDKELLLFCCCCCCGSELLLVANAVAWPSCSMAKTMVNDFCLCVYVRICRFKEERERERQFYGVCLLVSCELLEAEAKEGPVIVAVGLYQS